MKKFRALPTSRKVTIAAVLMILAQTVFRGYLVGGSWFYSDDFLFLGDIGRGDDDTSWYFRFHFQHFMPLSFLLVKLATFVGPFSWAAAASEIIVLQFLASIAALWMLRTLFGNRPAILVPLAFYLFSAMTMPSVMWWAVAINQLPHQAAFFVTVGAWVLYLRSHRFLYAVLATTAMSVGYLTYTKTMLLPIMLALLTLLYFCSGSPWHRLRTTWQRDRRGWLPLVLISTIYLISYILRAPTSGDPRLGSDLLTLGTDTVLRGLVPSLVGGPITWSMWLDPVQVATASRVIVVIAWIAVVAGLIWAALTRHRALRALTLPIVYIGISLVLIFIGRLYIIDFVGTYFLARHMQYLSDAACVVTLSVGLMFLQLRGAEESSTPRTRVLLTVRPNKLVLAAIGTAVLVGCITSSLRYAESWNRPFPQRTFFANALDSIEKEKPRLADDALPANGMSPLLAPNNSPDYAFSPVAKSFSTHQLGNDLSIFRQDGSIAPAILDGPVRTDADEGKKCPIRVKDKAKTIPMAPVFDFPFWMAIEYSANLSGQVPLDFGIYRKDVPIETGRHTLLIRTTGSYDSITLRPLVGQRICVRTVKVGGLIPGPVS